jgi:hypothetical protein
MSLTPTGLANEIEAAFKALWPTTERGPLPAGTEADRGLLFMAVARGLLKYLETNQNDLIDSMRLTVSGVGTANYTVDALDLDITEV